MNVKVEPFLSKVVFPSVALCKKTLEEIFNEIRRRKKTFCIKIIGQKN